MQAPPKVTDVQETKREFILSLPSSVDYVLWINLAPPPCGSDAPPTERGPLAAYRRQRIPCLSDANRPRCRGLQQAREETHACGYAGGWTESVHCHHQGLRPRYPLWSYRHVHAAAVEVRRVKSSNAVELEKQPQQIGASPGEISGKATHYDRLGKGLPACPVAVPHTTRIEGLREVL